MKTFSKCTLSALAVTAMVVLALLSGGCNKNPEKPSGDALLGTWSVEFEEVELGGSCVGEYTFLEGGEGTVSIILGDGGQGSWPLLWRTEGNKLYLVNKENKDFYEELGKEWESVVYKVAGNQLHFYDNGEVVASFFKK
ncbi:MAG: hypothetical protein MJY77_07940 [Bacteroidaceae bacterium]|nr:hypothetical protein [Bacteroidaceae bacterium]